MMDLNDAIFNAMITTGFAAIIVGAMVELVEAAPCLSFEVAAALGLTIFFLATTLINKGLFG